MQVQNLILAMKATLKHVHISQKPLPNAPLAVERCFTKVLHSPDYPPIPRAYKGVERVPIQVNGAN